MASIPGFENVNYLLGEIVDIEVGQHIEVDVPTTATTADGTKIMTPYTGEINKEIESLLQRLGYYEKGREADRLKQLMFASAQIAVGKLMTEKSFQVNYGDWHQPTEVVNVQLRPDVTTIRQAPITTRQQGGE